MKCKDFLQELCTYLDGDSAAELRAEVERHMQVCRKCWVVVDTCRRTILFYQDQQLQPIPAPLHERLMRAVEERRAQASDSTQPDT